MSKEKVGIKDISRYLGGFAALIAALAYISVARATDLVYGYDIAKILYYLGFIGLILAIITYTIKEEKTAKILFGGSIFITALSLLLVDAAKFNLDTSMYFGAAALYLLLGIILVYYFISEEKLAEAAKKTFEFIIGIFYLIAIFLWVKALKFEASVGNLLFYNYLIPQTLLLGGVFGLFLAILLILDAIIGFIKKEGSQTKLVAQTGRAIKLLLVFTWILGFVWETLLRTYTSTIIAPGSISLLDVLTAFNYLILQAIIGPTLFFSVLLIFLVYHVVTEYAL
ncbi:MAG: hypothetical protein QXH55_02915 [Candidatus Korarchaeota archaeon]|nr:hypothetical protein [Thermoproteota archaeon]